MRKTGIALRTMIFLFAIHDARAESLYVLDHYNTLLTTFLIDGDQLVFQYQLGIPDHGFGPIDAAIDNASNTLLVSYESNGSAGGNIIELFDARSLKNLKTLTLGSTSLNLTGIVYDPARSKLYATNRNTDDLYVFFWDADALTLEPDPNNPIELANIDYACGLALTGDTLYVSDWHYSEGARSANVYSYDVSDDFEYITTVDMGDGVIGIAHDDYVDALYGGSAIGETDDYLIKRTLDPNVTIQKTIGANVIGIEADDDTGLVYITTYRDVDPNDSYLGAVEVWNPSLWTSDPNEEVESSFMYASANNYANSIPQPAGLAQAA